MRNQSVNSNSELGSSNLKKVPSRNDDSELAIRLREMLGHESVTAFGRRCGIGEATLRKYFSGTLPNSDNLVAIADAGNVNIEWLAAGRGLKQRGTSSIPTVTTTPPAIDELLLARAISAVEEGLRAVGRALPPDKHAKMILAAYNLLGKLEVSDKLADQAISKARAQVIDFIKLAS